MDGGGGPGAEGSRLPADVRVVAASHDGPAGAAADDLDPLLEARFGIKIRVPPLRERREDLPLLIWSIVRGRRRGAGSTVTRMRDDDVAELLANDWPGNLRELRNVVERALALSTGDLLEIGRAFAH